MADSNEQLAAQFRMEAAKVAEGTLESLGRTARMLDTYAPDCFPANEKGQIHFARALMEGAADEIKAFLAKQATDAFKEAAEIEAQTPISVPNSATT